MYWHGIAVISEPPLYGSILTSVLQRPKGLAPTLTGEGSTDSMNKIKETVNKKRFTKDDVCFSKETPLQKYRRGHINEIEHGLLQHPLALYPHMEKGVEPDVSTYCII